VTSVTFISPNSNSKIDLSSLIGGCINLEFVWSGDSSNYTIKLLNDNIKGGYSKTLYVGKGEYLNGNISKCLTLNGSVSDIISDPNYYISISNNSGIANSQKFNIVNLPKLNTYNLLNFKDGNISYTNSFSYNFTNNYDSNFTLEVEPVCYTGGQIYLDSTFMFSISGVGAESYTAKCNDKGGVSYRFSGIDGRITTNAVYTGQNISPNSIYYRLYVLDKNGNRIRFDFGNEKGL
jgi:hypothetical protein